MSTVSLTQQFTTDEREGDIVSITLVLSQPTDEAWKRSFNEWITDEDWLGADVGVILGHSFPFAYDDVSKLELRTRTASIDTALDAIAKTIGKVNDERTHDSRHTLTSSGMSEKAVQAWFDRQ